VLFLLISDIVWPSGNTSSSIYGISGFFVLAAALVWLISTIRITISDDGILEYSYFIFIKKKITVKDVDSINRASSYKGLGSAFGYQMFVYYKVDGQENVFAISENSFGKKVIKKFINDLVKINPNIQVDKYYRSLIND
jgi:hypothetical protein